MYLPAWAPNTTLFTRGMAAKIAESVITVVSIPALDNERAIL
jgi:hypothetical protein